MQRFSILFAACFFLAANSAQATGKILDGANVSSSTTAGVVFSDCPECPEMVVIPSGSFQMGDTAGGGDDDERPVHTVTIPNNFAVGLYEVAFAEWDACVSDGGCNGYRPNNSGQNRNVRPVVNVNWDDAQAYVTWLSRKTGQVYRLLSEAEWEYAARAGNSTRYPWGNTASHEYMNYGEDSCCSGLQEGRDHWWNTGPVGSFAPNAFNLYDMTGNVLEWTQDCYNSSYTGAPTTGAAWTRGDCSRRILRGGSWYSSPRDSRSADRTPAVVGPRANNIGFRLARELD